MLSIRDGDYQMSMGILIPALDGSHIIHYDFLIRFTTSVPHANEILVDPLPIDVGYSNMYIPKEQHIRAIS